MYVIYIYIYTYHVYKQLYIYRYVYIPEGLGLLRWDGMGADNVHWCYAEDDRGNVKKKKKQTEHTHTDYFDNKEM